MCPAARTRLARLAILPPVLLGAAILWQATTKAPSPAEIVPTERSVPVAYVSATPRAFTPRISGFGTVQPARVWTAVAEVAGPVAERHPSFVRGGFVAEGEDLVRIAADDHQIALRRTEADLTAAEARLEEARASEQTTTRALAIEEEALRLAEADLARTERLAESGTVSPSVVDARRRDVLAQRSKVETHATALALLPAQIAALEAAVAAAQATRDAAALDLARTVVRAPFDARVARSDVEIGQFVAAGGAMGTLDATAAAEIDVQMPQNRMAALARLLGLDAAGIDATEGPPLATARRRLQPASATGRGEGLGDPRRLSARVHFGDGETAASWDAEVARLSDTVSAETRSVGVIVRVEAPYARAADAGARRPPLIKGMFVRVELAAAPVSGVILVPREAIRNGRVMLAGPDNRLVYARAAPVFTAGGLAVLAPGALPAEARIVTSRLSPAIEGLRLAPAPDLAAEARLSAAAAAAPAAGDEL